MYYFPNHVFVGGLYQTNSCRKKECNTMYNNIAIALNSAWSKSMPLCFMKQQYHSLNYIPLINNQIRDLREIGFLHQHKFFFIELKTMSPPTLLSMVYVRNQVHINNQRSLVSSSNTTTNLIVHWLSLLTYWQVHPCLLYYWWKS